MDSGTQAAIIGAVVGGFIALASSFGLQEWTQRRSDERERVKQQELVNNVRLLLHLEMQRNLDALARLWRRVSDGLEGTPDEMTFEKRMRFVGEPLPTWDELVWKRQIEYLPLALTPDEIKRASDVFDKLAMLREYHGSMVQELPKDLVYNFDAWFANPQRQPIGQYTALAVPIVEYRKRTEKLWQQCEGIMNELAQMQKSNPIPNALR